MPEISKNYPLQTTAKAFILPLTRISIKVFLILFLSSQVWASNHTAPKISVDFENTDLPTCIDTILKLAGSSSKIVVAEGVTRNISKTAHDTRWDLILKDILSENELKLTEQDGIYRIIDASSKQKTTSARLSNASPATVHQTSSLISQTDCSDNNLITLGYKYATGANPFALVGKCVKLKNVTPIQYLSAKEALVMWRYRGESGVVFVEDKSKTNLSINNANYLLGKAVGTYEYINTLGAKSIIPHLVIE